MTHAAVDVGRTIDEGRCGPYQITLVVLAALTIVFDGMDIQLLGVCIPSMMKHWNVTRTAFASVVAIGYLGMMIGGLVAGAAGDRAGRKTALLGSMMVFGVATLASATAGTVGILGLLRFVAGIGLGGAAPNAAALTAEYVPLRHRALAVTFTIVCVPLGATFAGLLAIPFLPAIGWRGLFAIGGTIPLVAAAILWRLLPESPRFLARHPHRWPELRSVLRRMGHVVDEGAMFDENTTRRITRTPLASLLERAFRRDTLSLWAAFFSCLLAVYLGFNWLPVILSGAGLGTSVASTGISVFNLGGVAGAIVGGLLIRRFGSRVTMVSMAAIAIASVVTLSRMTIDARSAVGPIILMLTLSGAMINAVQTTMYALAAHVYPTEMRATGVGTAAAIGRSGAILSGYAGPWALEYRGSASFFALMAAALTVTLLALSAVQRHVAHR
jgi:AAHS family 4-hydroxybenzoate transporter-like MFS transporter